jgi:glycine cleavage system regulatory protein
MPTSLVVTAVGPDRPGLVNRISDVAQRFGANWEASRMASLAGQFAGMIHFAVAEQDAAPLASALRELESAGLRIVIATGDAVATPDRHRVAKLEAVAHDRPGIVRDLSRVLAQLGVNIQELHTEVASAAMSGEHLFKVEALLAMPEGVANEALRRGLEALANEMMIDLETGER